MYKIAILVKQLNGGGAERSAGLISKIIESLGHDIYIVTLFDDISFPYAGKLINIGAFKNCSGSILNKFNRYYQLRKQLHQNKFDIVLDFRLKESVIREFLLNGLVFNTRMVNMVRSFHLKWYFPSSKLISKQIYNNYSGINTVSLKIEDEIERHFKFSNVSTIYSPLDIEYIQKKSKEKMLIEEDYIIAVGRLEPIKQFDKLLMAYKESVLLEENIKLYILGKGSQRTNLQNLITDLNLGNMVKLIPYNENPFMYMKNAKFLVLSSKNEGFPRVLLECLACETPVVSFNCNSGPSEIIIDKKNGLLVENQDFNALKDSIDILFLNKKLYRKCKANCLKSISKFSMESIALEWEQYINALVLKT